MDISRLLSTRTHQTRSFIKNHHNVSIIEDLNSTDLLTDLEGLSSRKEGGIPDRPAEDSR